MHKSSAHPSALLSVGPWEPDEAVGALQVTEIEKREREREREIKRREGKQLDVL